MTLAEFDDVCGQLALVLRECNASLAVIEERIAAQTHDINRLAERRSVSIRCRRQAEAP